ncbi:helix-turn-helix domain-containing protein [Kitasatospora sp. CB02891]|uniref:winged helix-turn-helix domain-containing protein n=1 Tax=Kitasatospora sp. CB02891 TaxID=2020329 RepID=UPI001E481DEA|nr:helix-turn-helix domain-containing protein [Kitasatospora sp. CB02891]
MTDEIRETERALPPGVRRPLPDHPVRIALLDLLAEAGTVTSTGAAARLGLSSGLCSFHLRQLARYGLVEEVPQGGRARPWRLRWETEDTPAPHPVHPTGATDAADAAEAPEAVAEPFTAVLHLTPAEADELRQKVRALMARYVDREDRPSGAQPYAAAARIVPLLPG